MEKKNIIIFTVGILAVALAILFLKGEKNKEEGDERRQGGAVSQTGENVPTSETVLIAEKNEDIGYVIDVEYPKIANLKDKETEDRVNQEIKTDIENTIPVFSKNSGFEDVDSEFKVDYAIEFLSENLLSVRFFYNLYEAGAAHSNVYIDVFNYDFAKKKRIGLSDIFAGDSKYIEFISQYSINDIFKSMSEAERKSLDEMVKTGAGPKEENFANFVFNEDNLTFIFNPYQVAPYAAGVMQVRMPYEELKNILDADGSLSSLMR